ncbi:MAG: copper-binding protein [Acidobacteriota bacterium]
MRLNRENARHPGNSPRVMRTASGVLLTALIIAGLVSCSHRRAENEERFELKGKVVNVDKRGAVVSIAHESIPGYMEGMTMPFKLKDSSLLDVMTTGDRVQATLVVAGARSWLEDVVVVHESVDASATSSSSLEPKPGDEVPDFTIVNQNGKRVSFHQYRGRIVLLTFIYTRCPLPDYCPLMTENFSEIEKALKSDPELYSKTRLLSISVDPEFDKPKVLREYAAAHGADTAHWDFAGGTKDEVKKVATYFGMQYWREGDQVIHSLRTAIVGADGKLVKVYRGNEWKPEEIATELRSLASPGEQRANSDNYHGVGVIESIDREGAFVQIDHEDIKDLMPAMNMPYRVKDKSLLDSVAPGDKVDFWLESTPSGLIVVRFQKR